MNQSYTYRSASGLVLTITVLMVVYGGMAVLSAWSNWLEIRLLESVPPFGHVDPEQGEANDARQGMIGLAQAGLLLTLAILFLMWVNRANKNARALGAAGMEFTPGWCVGWFFIPIANLFKPYQAVREIWKASHPDFAEDWRQAPASSLLGFWWALWIITNVLSQIALRLSMRAERISELLSATWIDLISDLIDIPLVILALSVVRGVHAMQERKSDLVLGPPGDDSRFEPYEFDRR